MRGYVQRTEMLSFWGWHPLAKALANGRLPGIRHLDLSRASWDDFMIEDLELLREAIEGGLLPSLTDLKVEKGVIIRALRTSFDLRCPRRMGKRHEGVAAAATVGKQTSLSRPGQAWIERVVMVANNLMENHISLQKLLALPTFSRVRELCSVH